MLIRNIIVAFVAFFVMATAAPAFAKTNAETVACRDAGFAALPFTGTATEKEAFAKNLAIGTEVLVDGITVKLDAGQSLWSRCKTGPTELEIANARVSALETENARLAKLAYHTVADGSGRQIRVSWKATATAIASERDAAQTTVAKDAITLKAARDGDVWQNLGLGLLLLVALFACFRQTIGMKFDRWMDERDSAKARKNAKAAPMAPAADTDDTAVSSLFAEQPDFAPIQA